MKKTVETNYYGEVNLTDSEVDIIELIKKLRNDLIKDFLDERFLKEYFHSKYHLSEISSIKMEFIRKDLKELFGASVNTEHYEPIITEIKTNERTSLAEGNEQLFYRELEGIFQKYIY